MSKILVVDDEVKECELLERFLKRKCYEVFTSCSGKHALENVRSKKPDIILLDIDMPEMDGIEVLKRIREFDKDVCIIMVTVVIGKSIAMEAIKAGADEYVTKPVDLNSLEKVIRNTLHGKFEK
ncbi:MAG: response regulator [Candidatus Scalindua rubra]|uniref:Sigma 54 response regulator n=1 Tax=Candidatus Scalindua brodae TaxID=237368 RepID=A0A0B0ESL0_9BACT|nr:MAG: sigma 54 response regulator [Candidatus Scalindua brodae]MBZ0109893.1 response regulator [Candidatus Scalindua rubra]